ncbi:sodium channel subunit beta-1 isoform X2 [Esox lucius]|nr:sodium channel subunit beta-1 isoform X2 [Esox lucius]
MICLQELMSSFLVFILCVSHCHGGCAEVDSMTEAVAGESFLLGCISCKRREEVPAHATVDWHFKPTGEDEYVHIFHYDHPHLEILNEHFFDRLEWQGTMGTQDVQTGAVFIHNVTFNDTGTYRCTFQRTLSLPKDNEYITVEKEVELIVVAEANREMLSVVSEIMMYVLIVVLQLWMFVVLIYCYRKIWAEHEARDARKALKAQKKALLNE